MNGDLMQVAYWIIAALLTLTYLYSGGMKLTQGRERLVQMMRWVDRAPMAGVKAIGVLEVLGAIGLILPPLTGIAPWLAVAAAVGLVLLQIGAITLHLARGEARQIGLNVALLVLAVIEVWLATMWV
ncbi:DoxX family protein [Glaciibacter superstes]|uniref:DoxX family protein n=1 Tax=Glaciibacter superstes TaxID=501023 RepID=UPI0003B6C370|nr:DoxX family protein [Glaciibacter superstes]